LCESASSFVVVAVLFFELEASAACLALALLSKKLDMTLRFRWQYCRRWGGAQGHYSWLQGHWRFCEGENCEGS